MHLIEQVPEMLMLSVSTQDDEQTHQDGGQGSHAQSQYLSLLHQLAVGASVAGGTEAGVSLSVVSVDAGSSVQTGVVKTLVPVLASFTIRSDSLTSGTPDTITISVSSVSSQEIITRRKSKG